MRPDAIAAARRDQCGSVERLALTLLSVGPEQSVRVLEALAAALANHAREPHPGRDPALSEPPPMPFLGAAAASDFHRKLELCRRIARRALRGSLADPTLGATAFHRLDGNPAWARDLLPVATFGPFLFYKLAAPD